ncbi:DMT family transporter [Oceanobacillus oncorhynchi]|uniref:DMT family transporter n=1 Tax=Oceanobacillus oncorhynchi TaxID=545501 RepID=UPI002116FABF|nr:DMT family transporter [Oceanobacillus oncorhynchi]MDM8100111.1 DMT family transporter [Oceanobacillus oncorhynchi]UUI41064.1 DMT family transporter [Oceanobacillus oncorhynchi]
MRQSAFNPKAAVVIGVFSISTSAILVRLATEAPASIIANYRLLFAVLLLLPFILFHYKHEFKRISTKNWWLSILAGIFLALYFILWFESLNYTSVASSVVLISLQPIFAFIGTYFIFGERFSSGAIISIFIVLLGGLIIGSGDFQLSGEVIYGDMLALLGAIAVTIYFLSGQHVRKNVSLITYTFIVYGISTVILTLFNLIRQESFFSYPANHWWIFIALAIIPTFLGHSLFNWSLKWLSTSTISMAIVFEPIGASILAFLILNETPTWAQFLGGTIIVFGLFLFILSTSRKNKVTISTKNHK